jgi:hypothetical protein
MHARTGTFKLDPAKLDDAASAFQSGQLTQYRQTTGYRGFTMLVNRTTGEAIGLSLWETEDDLRGSDALARAAREEVQRAGGGRAAPQPNEWEVAFEDSV